VLITGGWIAGVIALWGVLAASLDLDPIEETDASPALAPAMIVLAAALLLVVLIATAASRRPASTTAGAVAGVYLVMLVVGALSYALSSGGPLVGLLFLARHATSPFVIGAALLAAPCVLLEWLVAVRARRRDEGTQTFDRSRPLD
jgi:hypothetical protein